MDAARTTVELPSTKEAPSPAPPVKSPPAPVIEEPVREAAHEEGHEPAAAVLVDDPQTAAPGQVSRAAFMAELRARLAALCDEELAAIGRTAADCPYLRAWLDYYDGRSAAQIERAIRAYTGAAVPDAAAIFDAVTERVRGAVRIWVATGKVSGIPEGVTPETPSLQRKPAEGGGGPGTSVDPLSVRQRLGAGAPMDPGTRSRMERGFGHSFEQVHVHTDAPAAALASSLSARAFTVGNEIAFAAGEYRPGTLEGDLLLAHELSHTIQQSAGALAASASPGRAFEDSSLEREADRGALFAVAPLWGLDVPFLSGKIGELRAPKERTGLALQGCETEQKLMPEAATGSVPDYNAFSDPSGLVNTPERERALLAMVQSPDQLDQVYWDAQPARNNPRAQYVWRLLEVHYHALGQYVASQVNSLACMAPGYQELGGACTPNWSVLSYLSEARAGGARLLELVALGYSTKSRELQLRNEIIVNGLNLLLAGWAARAALAGEARALNVQAPKARPLPEKVVIPPEMKALDAASVAERLSLPAPPEGYRWAKTSKGRLVVRKEANRPELPKRRYDPKSRTFPEESQFKTPKDLVKPSAVPAELQDVASKAIAARDAITTVPEGKTVARSPAGLERTSGWGSDIKSLDPVRELSKKIGHEPQANPMLDAAGQPGSYNLSHAEKQVAAVSAGGPIGVSRIMCMDCQIFFKKLANHLGKPVVVADPAGVRVFFPDGRVVVAPTVRELMGPAVLQGSEPDDDDE